MANRYRGRGYRSRTPDPESSLNQSWMATSPRMPRSRVARRSLGGWGSMGNLDQIMNSLQESIQQKHKDCCSSFESLDNLSDEDDDSGIRLTDSRSKWKDTDVLSGAKHKQVKQNMSEDDEDFVFLPRRKNGPRSLQGSRENISSISGFELDYRTNRRTLPKVHQDVSPMGGYPTRNQLRKDVQSPPSHDTDEHDQDTKSWNKWQSGQNISGFSDIDFARAAFKSNTISDNWIMKQPDRDMEKRQLPIPKSTSGDAPVRPDTLSVSDMNNNDDSDDVYTPRFTKHQQSIATRQIHGSRTRSRWDTASPVSIKHEDLGTEILTRDGRLDSNGYHTLPLKKKSPANARNRQASTGGTDSSTSFETLKSSTKKSDTKPSPNPNFRKGFSLNAQRQLSYPSESDDSTNASNPNKSESVSPRSRWDKAQIGHSVLSEAAKATNADFDHDNANNRGGTVLFIDSKDESSTISPPRKVQNTDNSPGQESDMVNKNQDESPNKSYEAFYVSYGENDQGSSNPTQPEEDMENMTEEERAIKFPQWVIPFIDDNLAGKFEYSAEKRAAMAKKQATSTPRRKAPSPGPTSPMRTKAASPRPSDSGPVAPPRVKRTAAMTRILQEKDYLACRERPLPEKADKPKVLKVPERVKSPVARSKKLPLVPSESGSIATSADCSESESFPVHYVKHAKAPSVSVTKGAKLRTGVLQKSEGITHSQSDTILSQRARSVSKPDLTKPADVSKSRSKTDLSLRSRTTSKSTLASKRAKSMDNLAVLSSLSSDEKNTPSRRTSTGGSLSSVKLQLPSSPSSSGTNVLGQTENRAMRLMREARAQQSRSTGADSVSKSGQRQARTPVRKEPLTPTSSNESRDRRRSSSTHGRFLSGRTTPVDKSQDTSTTRTRARARFDRQDSTESESTSSEQRPTRTRSRTPVRRSTSLSVSKEADDYSNETFTLPRRRPQAESSSVHSGGYGTLKTNKSTTAQPKKSILKKTTAASVSKACLDTAEPSQVNEPSGKRVLPRPPDDIMDDIITDNLLNQSWISSSRDNLCLSRSSSRDDLAKSPPTPRSRAPSSSSDGSAQGLRRTSYTSSRENLRSRSNSRDDALKSPTTTKPKTGQLSASGTTVRSVANSLSTRKKIDNASDSSTKGLRKSGVSSSRENPHKRTNSRDNLKSPTTVKTNSRDNLKSPTTVKNDVSSKINSTDNPIKSLRRTGFTSSRENLFKSTAPKENLNSGMSKSRENPLNNSIITDNSIKSVKSPACIRNRAVSNSSSRIGRQSLLPPKQSVPEPKSPPTLSKSGLQPVDSIKINKKLRQPTSVASSRKVSDRFKKLLNGDVSDLSSPKSVRSDGGNDRETSFDSGVEFVMHL